MNLDDIRKQIDEIDHELANLFQLRMNLVGQVAKYKKANNLPLFDPKRESEILDRLAPAGAMGPYTRSFFNFLFQLSKVYQKSMMGAGEEND